VRRETAGEGERERARGGLTKRRRRVMTSFYPKRAPERASFGNVCGMHGDDDDDDDDTKLVKYK